MEIPSWVPIAISITALVASISFGVMAIMDRRSNFQISREREIYTWATNTLELVPMLKSDDRSTTDRAKIQLSVQIDIGRLLFPNDRDNDFGKEKHPLNQGFRSKVLDPLVELHDMHLPIQNVRSREQFESLQKDFIFEVSRHFPPVKTGTSPEYLQNWYQQSRKP